MKPIEAEGVRLTHLAPSEGELRALCGVNPFPSGWHQPVRPTKIVCRACYNERRRHRGAR